MTPQSISVVIPNYNGKELLAKHLPAVIEAVGEAEIIVVDDASTDDSVAFLQAQYPHIRIVEHSTNQRFARACNSGVAIASGEIIVLLNNDVSPTKDFLEPLLAPFEDATVFAVGCQEINDSGVVSGRSQMAYQRGFVVHWRAQDQQQPTTAWVSGGSGAFRTSIWKKLTGMDSLYYPAYEEDRDISYRAMKAGYQILFAPDSVVHHHHETTNTTVLGKQQMEIASFKNQVLFVWKNITDPYLLLQHICWLPYHLVFTTIRSNGNFLKGFLQACASIPLVLKRRKQALAEVTSDMALLRKLR